MQSLLEVAEVFEHHPTAPYHAAPPCHLPELRRQASESGCWAWASTKLDKGLYQALAGFSRQAGPEECTVSCRRTRSPPVPAGPPSSGLRKPNAFPCPEWPFGSVSGRPATPLPGSSLRRPDCSAHRCEPANQGENYVFKRTGGQRCSFANR